MTINLLVIRTEKLELLKKQYEILIYNNIYFLFIRM